jgi:toxin CcdB
MAQFDIFAYGDAFLLNVQSDLLSGLNTRMVAPLLPLSTAPKPAKRLNPVFKIGQASYVMCPQFMAAVPLAELGDKPFGSLAYEHFTIKAALDLLFDGV